MMTSQSITPVQAEHRLRHALLGSGPLLREDLVDQLIASHGLLSGFISLSSEILLVRRFARSATPQAREA